MNSKGGDVRVDRRIIKIAIRWLVDRASDGS